MAAAWNYGDCTGSRSQACVAMAAGGFVHTAFRALTTAKCLYSRVSFNPVEVLKIGQSWCEFYALFFMMLLRQELNIRDSWLKIAVFIFGVRDG